MSKEHDETPPGNPAGGHSASQIASDLTGLPLAPLVFRTVVDTVLHTPRIARDVLAGTKAYFSPLRLFISLMGLNFGAAAFFNLPAPYSLETLLNPTGWDMADDHIRAHGHTFAEVSSTVSRWGALLNWPLMALGAAPFLLVIKAFRPSISWWHHLQCYLAANNAMLILSLLTLPLLLVGDLIFLTVQSLTATMFFVAVMRIASGAYGLKPGMLAGFLLTNIVITVPSTALIFAAGMFSVHIILQWNFGLSLAELMDISSTEDSRPAEALPPPSATEE